MIFHFSYGSLFCWMPIPGVTYDIHIPHIAPHVDDQDRDDWRYCECLNVGGRYLVCEEITQAAAEWFKQLAASCGGTWNTHAS